MSIPATAVYVSSGSYSAATAWTNTAKSIGNLVRQAAAPAQGNERIFLCITAGTPGAAEPTWNLGKGANTTDGTVVWMEVTGTAAMNGDSVNTPAWTAIKSTAVANGQIIQNSGANNYFICVGAGTTGPTTEPTWNFTVGATTTDNASVTWKCIGPITNYSTKWKSPHARIENALANTGNWMFPGDIAYVDNAHTQTTANTLNFWGPGNQSSPNYILCVSNTAAPPTSFGYSANVIMTSAANSISFNAPVATNSQGSLVFSGINFYSNIASGTGFLFQNPATMYFGSCNFNMLNSNTTNGILMLQNPAPLYWTNTTITFNGNNSSGFQFGQSVGILNWYDTVNAIKLSNGTNYPTRLFNSWFGNAPLSMIIDIARCDFSAFNQAFVAATAQGYYKITMADCSCNSAAFLSAGQIYPAQWGSTLDFVRIDNGANTVREEHYTNMGKTLSDQTVYRSTGAAYPSSGNVSWKTDTTGTQANTVFPLAHYTPWIYLWNETTGGPVTANVYFAQNNSATALTQEKIWLEIEALDQSGLVRGSLYTTAANTLLSIQGTAANAYPTDSTSTWTGLTTPTKQVMSLTFTPQTKGPVRARIAAASNNVVFWVDPRIVIN